MALRKKYIEAVTGLTYVEDAVLGPGIEVMLVLREGKPLVQTTGTPTGRQFKHVGSEHRIYVSGDSPIMDSVVTMPGGIYWRPYEVRTPEIIYVEYKA